MTERGQAWLPWLGALIAALWVGLHHDVPLVEDSLFWWVPKGILAGETGFPLSPAQSLPSAMTAAATQLPQWSGGLPDYGHPPLWYWWLGLFTQGGASLGAIRAATLLPAMAAGAGFVALGKRMGLGGAGFAVFALPPFLAQLIRPELDLPLLALVPWALIALLDRAWGRYALLAGLAAATKEPGVLLVAPALVAAHAERRWRIAAITPLLVLGGWAWIHGWMAKPERLPDGVFGWGQDFLTVLFIVFIAQGRFVLLVGIKNLFKDHVIASFVVTWVIFFSTVGFFANSGTADLYTHVRYLLPGLAVAAVVLAGHRPWLAIVGLFFIHTASDFGPEASMFGSDQARSEQQAAPWISDQVDAGERIWVGTHQAAGLTQPWAGTISHPVDGIHIYSIDTPAVAVRAGDIVMEVAYGEPAGSLLTGRKKTEVGQWTVHDGWVKAWRIGGEPG
jgi:hypothetical protein